MARRSGPALPFRQKRPSPSRTPEEREWRTQQRYLKVLREVKEECGDTDLSSDEEGECLWARGVPGSLLFSWSQWCSHLSPRKEVIPVVSLGGWIMGLRTP